MRKTTLLTGLLLLLVTCSLLAQQRGKPVKAPVSGPLPAIATAAKKYPSLLWEISGNGLKKPSYLFGTMHVSDKLAFHLGDSFYHAIRSAEVVALETNPETWQDDYSGSSFFGARNGAGGRGRNGGEGGYDRMRITTFAIDNYEEPVKAALAVEPSMINGMLYRTYGTRTDDFEEDTFLDMYIFQVGKKLGKRLSGVENFQESEKLVVEAYKDMVRDRKRKRKSYDMEGMMTNPKKVEDAYRRGDLDLLDSLEALTVFSDAFQEKFLYKRNEIQANSIDSIIKKQSLFVGVGAAHLPGRRGVIEMLRKMGYSMRPVLMDDRNSIQKETIDKMRMEHPFVMQTAPDGFYKVNIPGKKFYRFTDWGGMDVVQYADMVNGAYYVVTRVKTNSLMLGQNSEQVYRKVDSLLYENIPGKIIKKTAITKNGYKGFDILNRTRRGDNQHYQIFITPFEIITFKMSGNGEYVNSGAEAVKFFGSVQLKEYTSGEWLSWQPATGGFSVQLPHAPALLRDQFATDRLEYTAWDKQDGNSYLVMKANLHNYSFLEEDSFELNLMDESYGFSSFIEKKLGRKRLLQNGYPAMECKYAHRDGSYSAVKYIIRGPVYYVVMVRYKNENANVRRFMESFSIQPFIYPETKQRIDTSLHYTVQSPVFPEPDKKDDGDDMENIYRMAYQDGEEGNDAASYNGKYKFIGNDTIGEKILVAYSKLPAYAYWKDSALFWKEKFDRMWDEDSTYVIRFSKQSNLANGMRCREIHYTDTGSSRMLMVKSFYKDGNLFSLSTLTDTVSKPGPFLQQFFTSFTPADTLKGSSAFTRKTEKFIKDLFSKDSVTARRAARNLYQLEFDSSDALLLRRAIDSLHWGMRDYLTVKRYLINQLSASKDTATLTYLKQLYWNIKDTAVFQQAILNVLTSQQTKASFTAFKELVLQEPPITEGGSYDDEVAVPVRRYVVADKYTVPRGGFGMWTHLYDTLALTKVIFPDILQLMNVDDYEDDIMRLLKTMVDSGFLKAADYEPYFSKLYLDAKQTLKKQVARQDKEKMDRAARKDRMSSMILSLGMDDDDEEESDAGNYTLDMYAALLLPFRDKNPGVQNFFDQLMKTQDRQLLYSSMMLLLHNKQPVPDSLFMKFAGLDKYRSELYKDLQALKMAEKFPARYKNQLDITRSLLSDGLEDYRKLDTVAYVDKLPVTYKGKKGFVYFYKYKRMRDDATWQLATVGMQPEKLNEVDVENDAFTSQEERKLENDKPVKEQLAEVLKEMIYAKRKSAEEFYEARNYRLYKGYMSEMVKNRRYRD
jgi:uncharacterized protein YbaP (TraB family)